MEKRIRFELHQSCMNRGSGERVFGVVGWGLEQRLEEWGGVMSV